MKRTLIIFKIMFAIFLLSCSKSKTDPVDLANASCFVTHGEYNSINLIENNPPRDYSYDSEGRLISYTKILKASLTYSSSAIVENEGNVKTIYKLDEKGRIVSLTLPNGAEQEFIYNADGFLIEHKYVNRNNREFDLIEVYNYIEGNLTSYGYKDGYQSIIEYNTEPTVENFFIYEKDDFLPITFTSPLKKYFGKLSKNLPKRKKTFSKIEDYTYTRDRYGNIIKFEMKNNDGYGFTIEKEYSCK
jgi:YD repeat-containing protein